MTKQPRMVLVRFAAGLLVALAVATVPVSAEVGVSIRPDAAGNSTVTAVYITGLTDDPDPIIGSWIRHTPEAAHRRILNDQGVAGGDGRPHATYLAGLETAVVVWARKIGGGFEIVISRFDRQGAGSWTAPTTIAVTTNATEDCEPVGVQDPVSGAFHVFWWEDEANPRILHSESPADLSSWSAAQVVSHAADLAVRPAAAFHDGVLHLVYEAHGGALGATPRQIVVGTLDQGAWLYETIASTTHAGPNRPEIHSAPGRVWVDWIDAVGQMTWTRRQGSGYWEPVDTEPFVNVEEREFRVRETIKSTAIE